MLFDVISFIECWIHNDTHGYNMFFDCFMCCHPLFLVRLKAMTGDKGQRSPSPFWCFIFAAKAGVQRNW
jgi:hypothetical protein